MFVINKRSKYWRKAKLQQNFTAGIFASDSHGDTMSSEDDVLTPKPLNKIVKGKATDYSNGTNQAHLDSRTMKRYVERGSLTIQQKKKYYENLPDLEPQADKTDTLTLLKGEHLEENPLLH